MIHDDRGVEAESASARILVTGITGYIGGRLAPRLLEAGYRVRVLVREVTRLSGRPWAGEAADDWRAAEETKPAVAVAA